MMKQTMSTATSSSMATIPDEQLVRMFKALAHPARLRIVQLLSVRQSCVCSEVVDEIPLAQATVSQHLKVLKEAGIITGEIQGPAVCYCLAPGALESLKLGVAGLVSIASSHQDVLQVQRKESPDEDTHTT
jgi:ArsR family transcriptional regulator